ncbi:mitogen-activated protein kinase Slt2p/MPK1 [Diutina catenulata]
MKATAYPGRSVHQVYGQDFIVDNHFTITKELGHGAYGIVCKAQYRNGAEDSYVAIKKITNIFSKKILCKRSLRELKLLQFFRGHKNITCLYDLDIIPDPVTGNFNDVYLYEELMECDMNQIIRSKQALTDSHYQSFVYQILCGLKYIHSADVLHRDLKPGNLLVNADCELKICDFGLARGFSENPEQNAGFMTEYVATRWYRAPEIMLSFTNYTKAIDIWSVGCILAELLGGKAIFRGKDYVDQLNQILLVLGTPPEESLVKIGSVRAQNYVRSLPYMAKVPFAELYPDANPEAIDLLEKMLTLDPFERITVDDALNHPYLRIWHDPNDEPVCQVKFDFTSFEQVDHMDEMKRIIIDEVKNFREFARKPIEEQQREQLKLQMSQEQAHHYHQQQYAQQMQFQYDQGAYSVPPPPQYNTPHEHVDTAPVYPPNGYDPAPRPQELEEFTFGGQSTSDLFRLEEELGFGMDGQGFH